jgi:hypothetical protein
MTLHGAAAGGSPSESERRTLLKFAARHVALNEAEAAGSA